jgi:hypothetical protein
MDVLCDIRLITTLYILEISGGNLICKFASAGPVVFTGGYSTNPIMPKNPLSETTASLDFFGLGTNCLLPCDSLQEVHAGRAR